MKVFLSWLLILGVAIFCVFQTCFADESVEKVDENTAKIVISSVVEKDGTKTTLSQERNFTLAELLAAKTETEKALASWQEAIAKAEAQIALQAEKLAMWDRLLTQAEGLGIVAKIVKAEPIQ